MEGAGCLPWEGNQGGRSTAARLGPSPPKLLHTSTRQAKDFLSPLLQNASKSQPSRPAGPPLRVGLHVALGPWEREWAHLLLAAGVGRRGGLCLRPSRDGLGRAQGQLESWAVSALSVRFPASWGPGWTVHALCLQAKALQLPVSKAEEEALASRAPLGPHRVLGRGFGAPGIQAPQGLCPVCAPHGKTLAPSGPEGVPEFWASGPHLHPTSPCQPELP